MDSRAKVSKKFAKQVDYNSVVIQEVIEASKKISVASVEDAKAVIYKMACIDHNFSEDEQFSKEVIEASIREICRIRREQNDGFDVPSANEKRFAITEYKALYNEVGNNEFEIYYLAEIMKNYLTNGEYTQKVIFMMNKLSDGGYSWEVNSEHGDDNLSRAERCFHGALKGICGIGGEHVVGQYGQIDAIEKFCNPQNHAFEIAFAKLFVYMSNHMNEFVSATQEVQKVAEIQEQQIAEKVTEVHEKNEKANQQQNETEICETEDAANNEAENVRPQADIIENLMLQRDYLSCKVAYLEAKDKLRFAEIDFEIAKLNLESAKADVATIEADYDILENKFAQSTRNSDI